MQCPRCDRKLAIEDRFCSRCGLARSTDGKPVDPLIGLTVSDRYRIEERIGVGGMGTVYRAQHVRFGQDVAIKVLHERYTGDKKLAQRFEKEALTYGQVSHPNLVGLHDFGRTPDGMFFMALEYCPGKPLSVLLREQGHFGWRQATDVVTQVAQGLGAAHDCGVVHRDLKPENIIMTEIRPNRYHVRLLDFGIAKREDEDGPRLTQAGMVFGTPEYMSPEQARGKAVDKRSDIYALGTLYYELIVGHPPFTGPDKLRVMQQQANEVPTPLSHYNVDDLPPAIEGIILKCLEKDPSERIVTTHELLQRIEENELRVAFDQSISELSNFDVVERDDIDTAEMEATVHGVDFASHVEGGLHGDTSSQAPFESHFFSPSTRTQLPIFGAAITIVALVIGGGLFVRGQTDESADPQSVTESVAETQAEMKRKPEAVSTKSAQVLSPSQKRRVVSDRLAEKKETHRLTDKGSSKHQTAKVNTHKVVSGITKIQSAILSLEKALDRQDFAAIESAFTSAEQNGLQSSKSPELKARYASAAQKYQKMLKSREQSKRKYLRKARKHLISADFRKASIALDVAKKQGATDAEILKVSGKIVQAKQALKQARQYYAKADCRKTLSSLRPIMKVTPKSKRVAKLVNACTQALPPQRL